MVGSAEDLARRLAEHEAGSACRTTALYGSPKLLYSEPHPDRLSALKRERQIKRWSRAKKVALSQGNLAELKRLAQSKRKRVEGHDNSPQFAKIPLKSANLSAGVLTEAETRVHQCG